MSPRRARPSGPVGDWRTAEQMAEDKTLVGTWYRCRRHGPVSAADAMVLGSNAYCSGDECSEPMILVSKAKTWGEQQADGTRPHVNRKWNDMDKPRAAQAQVRDEPPESSPPPDDAETPDSEPDDGADEVEVDEMDQNAAESSDEESDMPAQVALAELSPEARKRVEEIAPEVAAVAPKNGVARDRMIDVVFRAMTKLGGRATYSEIRKGVVEEGRKIGGIGAAFVDLELDGVVRRVSTGLYELTGTPMRLAGEDRRDAGRRQRGTPAPVGTPEPAAPAPSRQEPETRVPPRIPDSAASDEVEKQETPRLPLVSGRIEATLFRDRVSFRLDVSISELAAMPEATADAILDGLKAIVRAARR